MPEQGVRNTLTTRSFKLYMVDSQDKPMGSATGFYYDCDEKSFLITNRHVVAGTGVGSEPIPDYLVAQFVVYADGNSLTGVDHRVEIYEGGYTGIGAQPLWYEHPTMGPTCDVIALPFDRPQGSPPNMYVAVNQITSTAPVEPGCTVFIIGYPVGISVSIGFPVWKSGYIASEPYFDVTMETTRGGRLTIPGFFIDSLTREGMSGSPVYATYTGAWDKKNPYNPRPLDSLSDPDRAQDIVLSGVGTQFVGCYSGRYLGRREDSAALGLCWRRDVIELICRSECLGTHSHRSQPGGVNPTR